MNYRTQELHLQLPSDTLQDGSINILRFPELGTSLVITRGALAEGETLRNHFQDQLGKLGQQLQNMQVSEISDTTVGLSGETAAVELRSQFMKGPEQVYQFQLGLELPGRRLLSISYVKASPLGDAEALHWATIKRSLAPVEMG